MFNFNKLNKISGAQVIGMLNAGEYVFDKRGCKHYFKEGEGSTLYVDMQGVEIPSQATYNSVINGEWFLEREFDPRKEMFDKPNEWVAKYFVESEQKYDYLGFDSSEMCAVFNRCLEPEVTVWSINADIAEGQMLDKAVPLDEEDLKVISEMKLKLFLKDLEENK